MSRLNETVVDVAYGRFDQTAEEGNGDNRQGNASRQGTDRGAGYQFGKGNDGNHENDKGHGTNDVDNRAEDAVNRCILKDMPLVCRNQKNAQGDTDAGSNDSRNGNHEYCFFYAL